MNSSSKDITTPPTTLILVGGFLIIVGSFLKWNWVTRGTGLPLEAFVSGDYTDMAPRFRAVFDDELNGFRGYQQPFWSSAGFLSILIGVAALAGSRYLRPRLAQLAGGLAVLAFVLFAISLARGSSFDPNDPRLSDIRSGILLVAIGGLLTLIGAFRGRGEQSQSAPPE